MRTWPAIVGCLVGAAVGVCGTLWLTWVVHSGYHYMWPLSALQFSFVFGLPLGTAIFGLLGYAFGIAISKRSAVKSPAPHMSGEASSASGQSPRALTGSIVLSWIVPAIVALLLAALAVYPLPGWYGFESFPLLLACWFVIPVALFLGYYLWMWSSHPRADGTKAPADFREAVAKQLLVFAGRSGSVAYGFAVPVAIVAHVLATQGNLVIMFLVVPGAILALVGAVAFCLFFAGLWTQAVAGRWHPGLTLWNGILFGLVLLVLSMCWDLGLNDYVSAPSR